MATLYISPAGAGDRSGSSWANAARITSLNDLIDRAGPNGQVLLRADMGSYRVVDPLVLSNGGSAGRPVTVRGVDKNGAAMHAVITGDRPSDWRDGDPRGGELFKLVNGASNLKFTDLTIRDVGVAFRAGTDIMRITIDDVDALNVARYFENWASNGADSATVSRLTIRDVEVTGFSEGAIRLRYDTNTVKLENVHGDAGGQIGEDWNAGVQLDGSVHDVLIRNSSMNNVRSIGPSSKYWNGDGFVAERGVSGLRIENTTASGNTDAGFDLKSSDTVLVGAMASDNGRNYRFWGEATLIDSVGLDPNVRGGSSAQSQVWVASDADVTVRDSVFRDADQDTVAFEGRGGSITFDDVDVWHARGARLTALFDMDIHGLSEISEHLVTPRFGGLAVEVDHHFLYARYDLADL